MPKESTSARVASIAARGMNDPKSLTLAEIKAVCASCVTQYEKAGKKKGSK